jgi:hypothetical protein
VLAGCGEDFDKDIEIAPPATVTDDSNDQLAQDSPVPAASEWIGSRFEVQDNEYIVGVTARIILRPRRRQALVGAVHQCRQTQVAFGC